MGARDEDRGPTSAELRSLYERSPEEFTGARNQLASRLASERRKEAAAAVRRLRRPSPALWAIHRLASEAAGEVGDLLEVGSRLRRAQSRVMGGDTQAADTLRSLGREQRRILDRLRERAGRLLADAGHPASEATLRRVEITLRTAATADADVKQAVAEARLTAELTPGGFVDLPVLAVVPNPQAGSDDQRLRPAADAEVVAEMTERADVAERLRGGERELAEREAAAGRARDAAREAADRVRALVAELSAAQADSVRADQEARRSEAELAAARSALRDLRALGRRRTTSPSAAGPGAARSADEAGRGLDGSPGDQRS